METREYENQEAIRLVQELNRIRSASLSDRREARTELQEALKDPNLVAERVAWLLNGSYGFGAWKKAEEIAKNTRCNQAAQLGMLIASLEWQCPENFAAQAFNKLTETQQKAVNQAILAEIKNWKEEIQ